MNSKIPNYAIFLFLTTMSVAYEIAEYECSWSSWNQWPEKFIFDWSCYEGIMRKCMCNVGVNDTLKQNGSWPAHKSLCPNASIPNFRYEWDIRNDSRKKIKSTLFSCFNKRRPYFIWSDWTSWTLSLYSRVECGTIANQTSSRYCKHASYYDMISPHRLGCDISRYSKSGRPPLQLVHINRFRDSERRLNTLDCRNTEHRNYYSEDVDTNLPGGGASDVLNFDFFMAMFSIVSFLLILAYIIRKYVEQRQANRRMRAHNDAFVIFNTADQQQKEDGVQIIEESGSELPNRISDTHNFHKSSVKFSFTLQ